MKLLKLLLEFNQKQNNAHLTPWWVRVNSTLGDEVVSLVVDWNNKPAIRAFAAYADSTLRASRTITTEPISGKIINSDSVEGYWLATIAKGGWCLMQDASIRDANARFKLSGPEFLMFFSYDSANDTFRVSYIHANGSKLKKSFIDALNFLRQTNQEYLAIPIEKFCAQQGLNLN